VADAKPAQAAARTYFSCFNNKKEVKISSSVNDSVYPADKKSDPGKKLPNLALSLTVNI